MVACPGLTCASGYMSQLLPDDCCPSCGPIPAVDCATGMMSYQQERDQLVDKYQDGCRTAADCVAVTLVNQCESGCYSVAIWSGALDDLNQNLGGAAKMDCVNCMQGPLPPCVPPQSPICVQGECQFPLE
jgi:hypothetical protein